MEIFVATSNKGKIKEFKNVLEPLGYRVKSLLDLDKDLDIEENGRSYEENALIKAKYISDLYNIDTIADDSGFEVEALNNEPGIFSARFLGHDTSYDYKNKVIIEKVEGNTNRTCRFICVIALVKKSGENIIFRGQVEGEVAKKIEGENGFGYDPIFYYPPLKTTFANINIEEKIKISHRGIALRKLVDYLENNK